MRHGVQTHRSKGTADVSIAKGEGKKVECELVRSKEENGKFGHC